MLLKFSRRIFHFKEDFVIFRNSLRPESRYTIREKVISAKILTADVWKMFGSSFEWNYPYLALEGTIVFSWERTKINPFS